MCIIPHNFSSAKSDWVHLEIIRKWDPIVHILLIPDIHRYQIKITDTDVIIHVVLMINHRQWYIGGMCGKSLTVC